MLESSMLKSLKVYVVVPRGSGAQRERERRACWYGFWTMAEGSLQARVKAVAQPFGASFDLRTQATLDRTAAEDGTAHLDCVGSEPIACPSSL